MQEEVEYRTVALTINSAKMTGRVLQAALQKVLDEMRRRRMMKPNTTQGKQSVKELIGQNAGVSNIEVASQNIKSFERVARKYGVDYALKKDTTGVLPKYLVFFKARDADALTAAFTEFTSKMMRPRDKPSLRAELKRFTEMVKSNFVERSRRKERERAR
jgi:membrane-bound lytic murein transglycosylase B